MGEKGNVLFPLFTFKIALMEVYGPLFTGYASISRQNLREKPIVNTAVYHVLSMWKKMHTFRGEILQHSFYMGQHIFMLSKSMRLSVLYVFSINMWYQITQKLFNRMFGKQTKDMQKVLSTNV